MKIIPPVLCMVLAFACSSTREEARGQKTLGYAMIKSSVKKGQTTQAEILQMFGSPNIVTKNKKDLEVWTYSRQSSQAESGGSFGSILIAGGSSAYSKTSTESFDFIVTFDKNDTVEDYSVVSSKF